MSIYECLVVDELFFFISYYLRFREYFVRRWEWRKNLRVSRWGRELGILIWYIYIFIVIYSYCVYLYKN